MAFCTNCGTELTGEFCSQCGTPATGAPRMRGMNPVLKWVLISFGALVGLVVLAAIIVPTISFNGGHNNHAAEAEYWTVQTIIQSLMVDNNLDRVTPSTSGAGGEQIRNTGTQLHPTIDTSDYMLEDATEFCYRWDTAGLITFQYDVNADGNCALDAEQLFP